MSTLCIKPVEAMIYDDSPTCRESLKKLLQKTYHLSHIETEDNIVSLRLDLAINRPRLLVLDYVYEGGLNLPYVAGVLHKFKGAGVIYSGVDKSRVEKEIGPLPYNFTFVQKGDLKHLNRVLSGVLG